MNTETQYTEMVSKLNAKYQGLNASFIVSPWGGTLQIKVASEPKAAILREMYHGYNFVG